MFGKPGIFQDAVGCVGIHDADRDDDVPFGSWTEPNFMGPFCLTHKVTTVCFQQLAELLIDGSTHSGRGSFALDAEIKFRGRGCIAK